MSDPKRIKESDLASASAVTALGLVAVKHLMEHREASFYVTEDGFVEVAFPGEFHLDALPEEMAIQDLAASGKSDKDIEMYLRGRDSRARNRK